MTGLRLCHGCDMPQAFPWVPTEAPGQPRCSLPDVEPRWWLEPDLEKNEVGRADAYDDQVRAKVYCYSCPLVARCREAAWNEPGHVWGGLDALERYRLRMGRSIRIAPPPPPKQAKFRKVLEKVHRDFMQGCTTEAIAANMNLARTSVRLHIARLLQNVRAEREGTLQWESPAPSFEMPTTQRQYLYGLDDSFDLVDLRESA